MCAYLILNMKPENIRLNMGQPKHDRVSHSRASKLGKRILISIMIHRFLFIPLHCIDCIINHLLLTIVHLNKDMNESMTNEDDVKQMWVFKSTHSNAMLFSHGETILDGKQ